MDAAALLPGISGYRTQRSSVPEDEAALHDMSAIYNSYIRILPGRGWQPMACGLDLAQKHPIQHGGNMVAQSCTVPAILFTDIPFTVELAAMLRLHFSCCGGGRNLQ